MEDRSCRVSGNFVPNLNKVAEHNASCQIHRLDEFELSYSHPSDTTSSSLGITIAGTDIFEGGSSYELIESSV
jgi:hypothetical protein